MVAFGNTNPKESLIYTEVLYTFRSTGGQEDPVEDSILVFNLADSRGSSAQGDVSNQSFTE